MTHKKYTYFFKPTPQAFLYILLGVFINVLGNSITYALHAPVFLNSVGTIFCSCLLGPVGGCITGILGTIINNLHTPVFWLYAFSCVPISIGIGAFYKKISLRDTFRLACAGLFAMMTSTIISVPLNMLFRDGYIGNVWGDALIEMLRMDENHALYNCVLGQLFIELPDKMLTVIIAYLFVALFSKLDKNTKGGASL